VDLLSQQSRQQSRDAIAVLIEGEVPVADALAVAREMRRAAGPAQVVEVVRRSGKFGAQLKRLETAGFTAFVTVQTQDGAVVRGARRALA
jgi:histidyl-tRNA synthetase